jgi:hypothetical protein
MLLRILFVLGKRSTAAVRRCRERKKWDVQRQKGSRVSKANPRSHQATFKRGSRNGRMCILERGRGVSVCDVGVSLHNSAERQVDKMVSGQG